MVLRAQVGDMIAASLRETGLPQLERMQIQHNILRQFQVVEDRIERLRSYAMHETFCRFTQEGKTCTCGFNDLLVELGELSAAS